VVKDNILTEYVNILTESSRVLTIRCPLRKPAYNAMNEGNSIPQWDEHINGENVLQVAEFLLSLDSTAILIAHRRQAYRWINELKEALEQHHHHAQKNYWVLFTKTTRPLLFEHGLQHLKHCVMQLINVLTLEAQDYLLAYLANPNTGSPPLPPEDEEGS
jgi:hypothetical protein